ncbi:hypothetical protein LCGC14_1167950 [marine sediment metagenome]|uniref:Type II secretion system protein GspG C-terminal domain-containing protein n=1 Tax=marine sediment metagenome TaxID=412755 RepID=A0A0F9PW65_9ZZZZ
MELMVVVAISGILMAAAVPTFLGARNRANANACIANLEIIKSATREWALDNPGDGDLTGATGNVTLGDVDTYIDGGFTSLNEPGTGRYAQSQGADATWDTDDDVVATVANGTIADPECSEGGDHDL